MNKRLLAGLMALCLAAGAANAAFAEGPLSLKASIHTESTAPATGETAATPAPTTTPTATPETAATPAPQAATLTSVELVDNIDTTGELVAKVNGSTARADGVQYTWYRSKTGADGSWTPITGQAVSGTDRNLTDDRPQALNAALDTLLARQNDPARSDSDRYHYRVIVTAGGITLRAEARVNYYTQLQNGSFETPSVPQNSADRFYFPEDTSPAVHFLQTLDADTNAGIYWHTTASADRWTTALQNKPGTGNYIEIADASRHVYTEAANDPQVEYHITKAYDGTQFAELNCQSYGALYQDVLTVPGTKLQWSLAHAGRDGTDTMALLIAPVEAAEQIATALNGKNTSAEITAALAGSITVKGQSVAIRNYVVDGAITDDKGAWGVHNGSYDVPAGQYVSRFFFVAVASAGGDSAEGIKRGNLIDRVWFSTDPVPPVSGSGTLRIIKTLQKADDSAMTPGEIVQARKNLHFTVVNPEGTIVGDFGGELMEDDNLRPQELRYTLELPLATSSGDPCTYAVTETARGAPNGYECTMVRTLNADGSWADITAGAAHSGITLAAQTETEVHFENTYARATGSLTIAKRLPADADEALQADFAETVNTFTVSTVAPGSYTPQYSEGARPADAPETIRPDAQGRLQVSLLGAGRVTIPGLTPAGYTVTESNAPDLTNYYLTTPAQDRTRSLDVTAGGSALAEFTNTYEPYLSVIITKKVQGNLGDPTKDFAFTATVDTTPVDQRSAYAAPGESAALTDTGFTLRSGGSITLGHLRAGQTLTLTETDPGGHTVRWQLNGDDVVEGAQYSLPVPELPGGTAEITCINTRSGTIPTGLRTNATAYLLLVGLCWVGWQLLRRRGA